MDIGMPSAGAAGRDRACAASLIFVVEDEPGIRNALTLTLQRAGYEVQGFFDVEGVISALDRALPFMVVLDVALQKSDAIEVLQALSDRHFDGAVQLLSGNSSGLLNDIRLVGERRRLQMLPALRKPCRMQAVRAVADSVASSRAGGATLTAPTPASHGQPPSRPPVSLTDALDEGRLEVWYQPKLDLASGALIGAECLSRLRRPDGGVALPGAFLPGATPADMERLTEAVLRRALTDGPDWAAIGLPLKPSVNVSCEVLSSFPLAALLRDHVGTNDGWPGLMLEITEENALKDVGRAHEVATQLRIYGVELSIDDFGLGYSSLSRLRDVPFQEVKLDRSLVQDCATDRTRTALCKAVVDLAHSLGAAVVAEGLETAEDLACLQALGCDTGQGYLLGRPMPKADLLARIASGEYVRALDAVTPHSGQAEALRLAAVG